MRLGFAVKVMGRADLPSNDARRWQSGPHLRVSLGYLAAIFAYLAEIDVAMYRISSDLAPYITHPDLPQFHDQIEACAEELAALGRQARAQGLRLSFHPSQYVLLNSPDAALTAKSTADLAAQARILDTMGLGPEAVVVTHVGGVYGDAVAGRERWVRAWEQLPEQVRGRLVLENDDARYGVADIHWIHERTGVRLIFDYLHHWCHDPVGLDAHEALAMCLRTWPDGVRPKIHFSSPRTEQRLVAGTRRGTGAREPRLAPPLWSGHADYINPFEYITFLRGAARLPAFDVMLECKLKDVALLRLREDLRRYAPDLAQHLELPAGRAELPAGAPGEG